MVNNSSAKLCEPTYFVYINKYIFYPKFKITYFTDNIYLINGLASAEDEINSTLNGAVIKVMAALIIPQSVLNTWESTSIERILVSCYHRRHSRHPGILISNIRTVIRVLLQI